MAQSTWHWKRAALSLFALSTLTTTSSAIPTVAFPFNSQVPTVARVDQPYLFQISDSTFAPDDSNLTYSISSTPNWLSIDSASRTLSGTPAKSDEGSSTFILTAADDAGSGHMTCILVVSADPAPQLAGDISKQLAATANLSSSEPPMVTILSSTGFHFSFQQTSFIDIVQRKLYYYSTLEDHTPLPAWLLFDPVTLTFSGTTPLLSAFPQAWQVNLIASDVAGFAGAIAAFTIAVGSEQLAFVPGEQMVNVTAGEQLNITALASQLYRNGVPTPMSGLAGAEASSLPSWAVFDASSLTISGTVPANVNDESISVSVTDKLGDNATAVINLVSGNASLFAGSIGSLTAYAGEAFSYHFSASLFSEHDLDLSVTLPATATWLHFVPDLQDLQGTVPTEAAPTSIQATLAARPSPLAPAQTQTFTINVKAAPVGTSVASRITTHDSPTSSSTSTPLPVSGPADTHPRLSNGAIAAIVVLSTIAAALLIALLVLCLRRRNNDGYERHSHSPLNKRIISRPIMAPEDNAILVTTDLQRDVEKATAAIVAGPPPQIALNLPSRTASKRSRWLKRFSYMSHASSIGNGEDAIRRDENIPEWGAESTALHAPHDSFSVPAEMARVSRQLSQSSPTKRALKRLKDRRQSRSSIGLGIDTGDGPTLPRHSSRRGRTHRRGASSFGLAAIGDRSSQASFSTRGTSLLSTQPSDFPRPPRASNYTLSRSIPTLSITDADRHRSIRLVGRSDSIADDRSVADKRQSFIRNRASTSLQSPLFSHGSRAPSKPGPDGPVAASSARSARRSRRGKSMLASYSESSSLEPQRESKRLSARVRSAFAPNYPRTITQSSLGADDELAADDRDSGSAFYTTSSSISEEGLAAQEEITAQLALPRHKRDWVVPGEASPTPPPVPPTSHQPSSARHSSGNAKQKWRERMKERSSSPLSTAIAVPLADRGSHPAGKASVARRSRLSEPISLVSDDSVSRAKMERPRLVHTSSGRPVSVEEVKRLSSLKAETGTETDTQAGSEMWEDVDHGTELDGSGLMPKTVIEAQAGTQRSNMSGPAFL